MLTPRPASRRPPSPALSSPLQQALAVLSPCGRSEWVQAPAALPAANTPRQGGGRESSRVNGSVAGLSRPSPPLFLARGKRAGMAVAAAVAAAAAASLREH
ncbi:unnamed protein product [Arctogadus glacialis]